MGSGVAERCLEDGEVGGEGDVGAVEEEEEEGGVEEEGEGVDEEAVVGGCGIEVEDVGVGGWEGREEGEEGRGGGLKGGMGLWLGAGGGGFRGEGGR